MTTILTRAGYILQHSWGKPIKKELMIKKTMHIAKNGRVFNDKRLYFKKNWDQDARLKAIYLDKVVCIIVTINYQWWLVSNFC